MERETFMPSSLLQVFCGKTFAELLKLNVAKLASPELDCNTLIDKQIWLDAF